MMLDPERTYDRYVGEQSTTEFLATAVEMYLSDEPARQWVIESGDNRTEVRDALVTYLSPEGVMRR